MQVFTYEFLRGLAVRIEAALCDGGVRKRTRSTNSILGRQRVETSCQLCHLRNEQHERIRGVYEGAGVHVVALRKVCEVSDVAALSDRGVRISTRSSNSTCLLYTSPSPRDAHESRMPSSA